MNESKKGSIARHLSVRAEVISVSDKLFNSFRACLVTIGLTLKTDELTKITQYYAVDKPGGASSVLRASNMPMLRTVYFARSSMLTELQ